MSERKVRISAAIDWWEGEGGRGGRGGKEMSDYSGTSIFTDFFP